jgi:hypothetical protein
LSKLGAEWSNDTGDPAAARVLLDAIREMTPEEACATVSKALTKGTANAGAVWDAVHLAGSELAMRCRGSAIIGGIHAVTAANGLRHSYLAAKDPATRYLLLLQGAGWMAQFRTFSESRQQDKPRRFAITELEESGGPGDPLEDLTNPDPSASRVLALAKDAPARQVYLSSAIRNTVSKSAEVHYYKYLAALVEDAPLMHPQWQPRLLAATVYYGRSGKDAQPAAMKRAVEALKSLA